MKLHESDSSVPVYDCLSIDQRTETPSPSRGSAFVFLVEIMSKGSLISEERDGESSVIRTTIFDSSGFVLSSPSIAVDFM